MAAEDHGSSLEGTTIPDQLEKIQTSLTWLKAQSDFNKQSDEHCCFLTKNKMLIPSEDINLVPKFADLRPLQHGEFLLVEHFSNIRIKRTLEHKDDMYGTIIGDSGLAFIYYHDYYNKGLSSDDMPSMETRKQERNGLNFGGDARYVDGVRVFTGCNKAKRMKARLYHVLNTRERIKTKIRQILNEGTKEVQEIVLNEFIASLDTSEVSTDNGENVVLKGKKMKSTTRGSSSKRKKMTKEELVVECLKQMLVVIDQEVVKKKHVDHLKTLISQLPRKKHIEGVGLISDLFSCIHIHQGDEEEGIEVV